MKKTLLLLIFVTISSSIIAQLKNEVQNKLFISPNDSLNIESNLFDVHIGYGTFSGGRIGVKYFAFENLSFEISYGLDWTYFFPPADEIIIYNTGLNWKRNINDITTYSMNFRYQYHTLSKSGYFGFSPSIGVMNFKNPGFDIWYRVGVFTSIYSSDENQFQFYNIGINLDVGISFKIQK